MSKSKNDTSESNLSQVESDANEIRTSLSTVSGASMISNKSREELLGVVYGTGMNVNNVIGSGIVTSPGIIWKAVKSPGIVLLLWTIGGLVSMAGSLSYVELGVIHRISGGETKYLQTAYPDPKLMMSYLFSFMFVFVIRPGIVSAVLQSAAQYLWYTVKGSRYNEFMEQDKIGWYLPFSPFWVIKLIAVLLLFIITAYHMLDNKWANYINQTLAAIKLTTYSIIAIAGIYRLFSNWSVSQINWQRSLDGGSDIRDYSTSILLIMFSYDGWNSLNYSLDEFRKTEKKLIFSNSISIAIVTLVYLLVNIAFISVVPGENILNGDKADETIAATFFRQLFGESEAVVRIFTGLIVLSVMGTAAAYIWSGSRVIVAAAKSNFFPIYSYELRCWNGRFNTPINALFIQCIWCSLIIFFVGGSFNLTSFTLFSTFSMYSYWIFYFATGIGLLVIRNKKNKLKNENETPKTEDLYKVPLPIAGLFILSGFFILVFSFVVNDKCPEEMKIDPEKCSDYSKRERIQKLSPMLISYGFLFIALMFWYFLYYWWDTRKKLRTRTSLSEVEKAQEFEEFQDFHGVHEVRTSTTIKKEGKEVITHDDISDLIPGRPAPSDSRTSDWN